MMRKRKSTASTGIQEHQTSFLGDMANTYCRLCRNDSLIIVGNQVQDIAQVNAVCYFTTLVQNVPIKSCDMLEVYMVPDTEGHQNSRLGT